MRYILALLLLCSPALLSAEKSCTKKSHVVRVDVARVETARAEPPRPNGAQMINAAKLSAWRRALVFEQQIL